MKLKLAERFFQFTLYKCLLMVIKRDLTPENSFSGCRPKVSEVLCTFSCLKKVPFLCLSLSSSLDRAAARKCLVIQML